MLTLSKSRKVIWAAIGRAKQLGAQISVAVCDNRGRLIAFNQMDGSTGWESDRSSMGKAVAAAVIGRPSNQLLEQFGEGKSLFSSHCNVIPPRGQRGGLPIVVEGIIHGGCGVSGASTAEQDEECAKAGIEAFNTPGTELAVASRADASSPALVEEPLLGR